MKNFKTVILAAGKGTRMKSRIPKVLHSVCGQPILQYVLDIARSLGSSDNFIVLGHKSEEIAVLLPKDVKAIEQKKLLGTADALLHLKRYAGKSRGDLLVLCADTPLLRKDTIKGLVKKHRKSKATASVSTAVVHNPRGYGRIIRDQSGAVVAIREDKDAEGYEREIAEINVGAYCFRCQELFAALEDVKVNAKKKEFYLTDIFALFFERKLKVETFETEDPSEGLGINTREDLAAAEALMRGRILKKIMAQGVSITDPRTTHLQVDVQIGQDTVIYPFTYIERSVRIGKRCRIGPFAHLRPGTKVGDDAEIGNFTEVSRTRVGSKTLMKHFSFLGDALVGSRVNIGAGTVTANFDGRSKNTTRIGDQAFVGSDSVLVAPVKIGKRAVVGAGSVVTKGNNVPDGRVAFGVPARIVQASGKKERNPKKREHL